MRKYLLILITFISACESAKEESETLFVKLPVDETGVDFANELQDRGDLNIIEYLYYHNGGGVAVGDLDNDGLEDLVFTANQKDNEVYFNQGDLSFSKMKLDYPYAKDSKWSTGVTLVDINDDGYKDIYICQVGQYKSLEGRNLLYINNGDRSFTESAAQYGLDFSGFSTHAAFFDYDKDGDLDMYLMNHSVHTPRSYREADTRNEKDSLAGDRLYQNQAEQGEVVFRDVTDYAGIYSSSQGYGLGLVIADLNGDFWPDIYVGNDFHENDYLYLNQQDGTFKESLEEKVGHTSRFTMGVDIADLTSDGIADIVSLDMLPEDHRVLMKSGGEDANKVTEIKLRFGYHPQLARNAVQVGNADGSFTDVALMTDLYATDWSWSALIQDYDLDGKNDLFVSNGIFKRPNDLDYINYLSNINLSLYSPAEQDSIERVLIESMPTIRIPNRVYSNEGDLSFDDKSGAWGLGDDTYSNGTVYADLDNDGDLELIINNVNQEASIYKNTAREKGLGNYLSVRIDDKDSKAIGATVILFSDGNLQKKENYPVRGFQSSVSTRLFFGLDSMPTVDSLWIVWPDMTYQSLADVTKNQQIDLEQVDTRPFDPTRLRQRSTQSAWKIEKVDFKHEEDRFNDYDREVLIPHKLSTEGPALAKADFNNDGLTDFFIGGAHNQPSALYLQAADGSFVQSSQKVLSDDADYEDIAAAFFDADKDGDLDLYVVSGGGYYPERSSLLQDRLYENRSGKLVRKTGLFPRTNGSCVVTGDFDNDGDADLFVGSVSIPGAYGVNPKSYFLINNGNFDFTMVPFEAGMIKSADYDTLGSESFPSLVLAGEWTPVTVLKYENNSWTNRTSSLSLEKTNGWWNAVKIVDTNGDGQNEIVATNLGLNAKVQASIDEPVTMYLGDFDNNGQTDPIIFYHKNETSIPFMSKDDLVKQIASLRKDFLSYEDFAGVSTIEHLIKGLPSNRYTTKEAYQFGHTMYKTGDSTLVVSPLPLELQKTRLNDLAIRNEYSAYAGNFFGASSNFGRYDAAGLFISTGEEIFALPFFRDKQVSKVLWIDKDRLLVAVNNDFAYVVTVSK
jgi:hypothetical protein